VRWALAVVLLASCERHPPDPARLAWDKVCHAHEEVKLERSHLEQIRGIVHWIEDNVEDPTVRAAFQEVGKLAHDRDKATSLNRAAAAAGVKDCPVIENLWSSEAATPVTTWPKSWQDHFGKKITVEGKAMTAKVGPMLVGEGPDLWIGGVDDWLDREGKRLRVTGIVRERNDLPVFVPQDGAPPMAGIPVPPGTDLAKASHRYLLDVHEVEIIE